MKVLYNLSMFLMILSLSMFCFSGCEELFINRGDLTEVNKSVGLLSTQVDASQALMTEIAMVTGKNIEETEAINKKIDEYQPMLTEAATQLAEAPTII